MLNLYAKPLSFDPSTNRITFELTFINEHTYGQLEDLIAEQKFHGLSIKKGKLNEPPEHKYFRWWWGDITEIIRQTKIKNNQPASVSSQEKDIMSDAIKKELIPIEKIQIGETSYLPPPPSLSSLSEKELKKIIMDMEELYAEQGIIFPVRMEYI